MSQISNSTKRTAKNTLLLYFRMLFMMVVSLYTSRVILDTLGVEDCSISENNESLLLNCRAKKMYEIVNKQTNFLTAFPSSQMNRTKLALAMSWRGNV